MRRYEDLTPQEQVYHRQWMAHAIGQAKLAENSEEVPIGAIVVKDDRIIATAYNLREQSHQATAHAELLAIEAANRSQDAWRLEGATLYVTLEPCPMCAGAIINARISRLVYGAGDPKAGCVGTLYNFLEDSRFNHQVEIIQGVMAEECGGLLSRFFRRLRAQRKEEERKAF